MFHKLPLSFLQIAAIVIVLGGSLSLTAVAVMQLRLQPSGELYSLAGQLLVAGQPAAGAEIRLHRLDADSGSSPVAWASPRADGSFEVFSPLSQKGARPGRYAVTVTWRAPVISGEDYLPGRNVVPARYASPHTTPLKVQVHSQDNRLPPWSLPACGCEG